jgi:hypothetical protein
MARIIVQNASGKVLLDERDVRPEHIDDEHSAIQLLDRLSWAISQKPPRRRLFRRRRGDA